MHYANMPNIIAYVIYCIFFSDSCENDNFQMMKCLLFLIFAQNIDCGHTLIELHQSLSWVFLMSTHNLCLRANNT